MAANIGAFEIIHAGAAEIAIREEKSTGFDDIDPDP
jgi:hypothetical protein